MRIYKYYSALWGREAILKQRLKLTTLADINDPFEFRAIGTKERCLRGKLEEWRTHIPGGMGLISFCGNRRNPVIWSHYADNYTGVCLGFDADDRYLSPIRYVSNRVLMTEKEMVEALSSGGTSATSSLLTTKFEHWRYEDEKRVFYDLAGDEVIRDKGLYFAPFGEIFQLREVIIGHNYVPTTDVTIKSELESVLAGLERCEVRTARPAFGSFEIVFQQDRNRQKVL